MARETLRIRGAIWAGSVAFLFCLICPPVNAKVNRKDVVIMKNGDHLTGEVKKLENGVLYIQTDYFSGSIGLDWLQVEKVESVAGFQITLKNGRRISGTIRKLPTEESAGKDFEIRGAGSTEEAAAKDVVEIEPQKQNFWRQLTGSVDMGYDFTSGNKQNSLTSDASANYLSTKWLAGGSFNSSFSGQSGGGLTNLVEGQTIDGRFLSRNSILIGLGDFLHSSQQSLSLRTTLGGGYGRYWIRSNHNSLVWLVGTVYTHEKFESQSGRPADQNVEGLLGFQYQYFRFDRFNLQSQLLIYPGLTDAGRIRTTTKTIFNIKLVNNFHTNFSFWDNFDSGPPLNSKRNELGVSTGLGWTF